jgi:hypothetical protein
MPSSKHSKNETYEKYNTSNFKYIYILLIFNDETIITVGKNSNF